ncbi:MAG: DUF1080 domain-containing protein [Verrucomicrobiota bacterium]
MVFQPRFRLPWFLLGLVSSGLSSAYAENDSTEWIELFDGKTLEGWTQLNGTGTYRVEDGAIIGRTTPKSPNSFLCTDEVYGDFELEFETKVDDELNSGVQIRSNTTGAKKVGRVNGPQVEIEAGPGEAGGVYGEAHKQWVFKPEKHDHFRNGEWNHFRVVAKGPSIRTFLNGVEISDGTAPEFERFYGAHPEGFIGLQIHSVRSNKGPFEVQWRNIRIREL